MRQIAVLERDGERELVEVSVALDVAMQVHDARQLAGNDEGMQVALARRLHDLCDADAVRVPEQLKTPGDKPGADVFPRIRIAAFFERLADSCDDLIGRKPDFRFVICHRSTPS
jgi:hypothetical protein